MASDKSSPEGIPAGHRPTLWFHGLLCEDAAESAATLSQLGVRRLVHGRSTEEVSATRAAGLEPWVCLGAFSTSREDTHLHCRSLDGEPRYWFGSGCPSNPAVRRHLLDRVREAAGWWPAGILLDGIRFASPYEGADTFLTCTCRWCTAAAADRGISMGQVVPALREARRRLAAVTDGIVGAVATGPASPTDLLALLAGNEPLLQWLRYRTEIICDAVAEVRAVLEDCAPGTRLGAYAFTPSLAPLVGQDYRRLGALLDVIAPMIYRLGDGPACPAPEVRGLASLAENAGPSVREAAALSLLGLAPAGRPGIQKGPELAMDAVGIEVRRSRSRLGGRAELVPVLWLDDPDITSSVAAAMSGYPEGISFYPTGESRRHRLAQAAAFVEKYR